TLLPAEIQYRVPTISCDQLDQRPVAAAQDEQSVAVACGRPSATAPAEKYLLDSAALVGEDIAEVAVTNEASGWGIVLTFTETGQRKWTELTTVASAGEAPRQVAIVADHTVILAPEIQAVIVGDAELSGAFTKDEADLMAARIGSGVLPITLVVRAVEHSG
ncbi:MAG: hypothetical protein JXA67_02370, partial [Micromonosporaceae bacterium]|nr:hypothetical protein [Micromonosporaceae bacterium]